jgi:sporulation protein YlmC with PRC-barrel domain
MDVSELDIGYRLLDDDLVDVNSRRCGKVDDLELIGAPGQPVRLAAILAGPGLWHDRVPRRLRPLARRLFGEGVLGKDVIRVPWEEVADVGSYVTLKRPAEDLGLGRGDDAVAPIIAKLPHSR